MRRTETDFVDVESLVRPSTVLREVSRCDIVLAVIPCSFLLAALASWLFSLPMQASIVAASFACSLAVVDALFVNPPRPRSNRPGH